MIKRFAILFIFLFSLAQSAFCYELTNFTADKKILLALIEIQKTGKSEVFENLQDMNVKIKFYDLSQLHYSYSNHYAVAMKGTYGKREIYINSRLRNSPPEALACLIAHESFHKLPKATLEEETKCTTIETKYWIILKDNSRNYGSDRLVLRLNTLQKAYITFGEAAIRARIQKSKFYQKQLANN